MDVPVNGTHALEKIGYQGTYNLAKGKWQTAFGYRQFRSFRHFVGSVEQNAENVLEIHDPALAERLAGFVDGVRARYPAASLER